MAKIGNTLYNPESGWKRYQENSGLITFYGNWKNAYNISYSGNNGMNASNKDDYAEFYFYGTKLTLIGTTYTNRSKNIEVIIDDIPLGLFSQYASSDVYKTVYFTIEKLEKKIHHVLIKNGDGILSFDALDIDEEGVLLNPIAPSIGFIFLKTNGKFYSPFSHILKEYDSLDGLDYNDGKIMYIENLPFELDLNETCSQLKKQNGEITELGNIKLRDFLSEGFDIVYFTKSDIEQISIKAEVEPFSVYDYISENPQAVVYTESTDDITVLTTTEPYDLYDEFGDELEVLYYIDDKAVTEADLILEANWSPIDELEGDFEVVTWTDEDAETAQRALEMTAIPKPQFIRLADPKHIYGYLDDVVAWNDDFMPYRDEVRYFITGADNSKWYVWDKFTQKFVLVDTSTNELVLKNGMKYNDLNSIADTQWRTWGGQYLNIGIFLKDNPRDTIVSVVEKLSYEDYLPRHSTTIENTSLYILNTTAKIDLQMVGNTLLGVLSDDDLTRVQYRVLINGNSYFPSDGSFTALGASPQNIELTVQSKDIKIDDWNTIRVEFQDFFGTTDYWANSFMGTYSGLMFKDVYGQYYSSEIGEVLQNLDFGVIIAGQTTIEHEIILKNQYGYDVNNVYLYANTSELPDGMTIQFSESLSPFLPQPELKLNGILENNEEMSFFVKIKTTLGATPNADGTFDIIVRADRVY